MNIVSLGSGLGMTGRLFQSVDTMQEAHLLTPVSSGEARRNSTGDTREEDSLLRHHASFYEDTWDADGRSIHCAVGTRQ